MVTEGLGETDRLILQTRTLTVTQILIREHTIAQKRRFADNGDTVSVRVRFWVRIAVRVSTFVVIDIVCFMAFLQNVFCEML